MINLLKIKKCMSSLYALLAVFGSSNIAIGSTLPFETATEENKLTPASSTFETEEQNSIEHYIAAFETERRNDLIKEKIENAKNLRDPARTTQEFTGIIMEKKGFDQNKLVYDTQLYRELPSLWCKSINNDKHSVSTIIAECTSDLLADQLFKDQFEYICNNVFDYLNKLESYSCPYDYIEIDAISRLHETVLNEPILAHLHNFCIAKNVKILKNAPFKTVSSLRLIKSVISAGKKNEEHFNYAFKRAVEFINKLNKESLEHLHSTINDEISSPILGKKNPSFAESLLKEEIPNFYRVYKNFLNLIITNEAILNFPYSTAMPLLAGVINDGSICNEVELVKAKNLLNKCEELFATETEKKNNQLAIDRENEKNQAEKKASKEAREKAKADEAKRKKHEDWLVQEEKRIAEAEKQKLQAEERKRRDKSIQDALARKQKEQANRKLISIEGATKALNAQKREDFITYARTKLLHTAIKENADKITIKFTSPVTYEEYFMEFNDNNNWKSIAIKTLMEAGMID